MYKQCFLCDSDALIKLMKATILKTFAEHFNCIITKEIEDEVVTAGKRSLHSDADEIETLIEKKMITVREIHAPKIEQAFDRLGKGERSLYALQKTKKDVIIISDDKTFVNKIREEHIPFITSLDCIRIAFELHTINKETALQKLENLKPYCNETQYQKIKKQLGE